MLNIHSYLGSCYSFSDNKYMSLVFLFSQLWFSSLSFFSSFQAISSSVKSSLWQKVVVKNFPIFACTVIGLYIWIVLLRHKFCELIFGLNNICSPSIQSYSRCSQSYYFMNLLKRMTIPMDYIKKKKKKLIPMKFLYRGF